MRPDFLIGEYSVKPGSRQALSLPLPGLHSDTPMSMPVQVLHGRRDGPVLFVSAAIHGDEINGIEIIRRLLTLSSLGKLAGTLVAIPTVNVFGLNAHSRYLPDRRDLNRSFPGKESGSLAARLAHVFMVEIVARCTVGIDLHTAAIHRDNFPQIRADLNAANLKHLARTFETPVILHSAPPEGSLRHAAAELSVPVMVYEAGEALRFDEMSIRIAVRGIVNVMRELGMLRTSKRRRIKQSALLRSSTWVRSSRSGILRAQVKLGSVVEEGAILGQISDPGGGSDEELTAPTSGIVIGRTNLPLIYEGDALFHIGRTDQTSLLEKRLDGLEEEPTLTPPELTEEPVIV